MSWLSAEKRALFQQIQEAQRVEDEAAALQARFQKVPDVGTTGRSLVSNRSRVDGGEQQRYQNPKGQPPADAVHHGPDAARAGPSHAGPDEGERAHKAGLQQQSSGNIARKLYNEDFGHRNMKTTSSTPALHLENFVGRPGKWDIGE